MLDDSYPHIVTTHIQYKLAKLGGKSHRAWVPGLVHGHPDMQPSLNLQKRRSSVNALRFFYSLGGVFVTTGPIQQRSWTNSGTRVLGYWRTGKPPGL